MVASIKSKIAIQFSEFVYCGSIHLAGNHVWPKLLFQTIVGTKETEGIYGYYKTSLALLSTYKQPNVNAGKA